MVPEEHKLLQLKNDELNLVLQILQTYIPEYDVWVFGSRACGNARQYSDLDLVIMTNSPMQLDTKADLTDAFSESDLPFKVDVVDWATTSQGFRKIIQESGFLLKRAADWVAE